MTGPNLPSLFDHTGPETDQGANGTMDGHQAQDTERARDVGRRSAIGQGDDQAGDDEDPGGRNIGDTTAGS